MADSERNNQLAEEHGVDAEAEPLLVVLLGQLHDILGAHGQDEEAEEAPAVDVEKARNVLEATAGDVGLAAQLYWDDYLASQQAQHHHPERPARAAPAQRAAPERAAAQPAAQRAARRRRRSQRDRQQQDALAAPDPPAPERQLRRRGARAQAMGEARARRAIAREQAAAAARPVVHRLHEDDDSEDSDNDYVPRRRSNSSSSSGQQPAAIPVPRRGRRSSSSNRGEPVRRSLEREFQEEGQARPNQAQLDLQFNESIRRLVEHARQAIQVRAAQQEQDEEGAEDAPGARQNVRWAEQAEEMLQGYDARLNDARLDRRQLRQRERAAPPGRRVAAANNDNVSANISDDENNSSNRRRKKRVSFVRDGEGEEGSDSSPSKERGVSRSNKRRKPNPNDDDPNGEQGYLSDNDWLWDATATPLRSSIPLTEPVDILWGGAPMMLPTTQPASAASASSSGAGDGTANAVSSGDEQPAAAAEGNNADAASTSNVIADDDGEEGEAAGTEDEHKPAVPSTWLNAGFSLNGRRGDEDDKAIPTGLRLRMPDDDDMAYFYWRHKATGGSHNSGRTHQTTPPPPYHCRALSGLLSIVTALLYTGSAVLNNRVICGGSRPPFGELDGTARRREFEARLADALSSLLFIAAKASLDRKRKALAELKKSNNEEDQRKWQRLERKIKLCPTCTWETDPSSSDTRVLDTERPLQVVTSYTNIDDLRQYVVSNMKSFTSSGGCALFLETILRIHGRGSVMKMVRHARREAGLQDCRRGLIDCSCNERHKKKLEAKPNKKRLRTDMLHKIDTTPHGHECMSVELLSLILTGRVYSTFQGWSTGPLGFGILSNQAGQMDPALGRPEKPVWVLRGPTCYSVLVLSGCNDHADTFSVIDQPGGVAELTHWNCWYGKKIVNKTTLRLVAGRAEWSPPKVYSKAPLPDDPDRPKTMTDVLNTFRSPHCVLIDGKLPAVDNAPEFQFTQEDLGRIKVNPDDEKFYPGKFRMWRYDVVEENEDDVDKKPRASQWTPFHRLSKRDQLLVETKLGPQIKTILLTRWPRATIDKFDPAEPAPVV